MKSLKALEAEAKRKREKLERKEGKIAAKRLKEFTSIGPANKKTKWYY